MFAFRNEGPDIYRSTGGPFEFLFPGFAVAVFDPDPQLVRATNLESLLTSRDGGLTWESLPFPPEFNGRFGCLWLHPSEPETVYLRAHDPVERNFLLLASEDGGETWRRIDEQLRAQVPSDRLPFHWVTDLEISPLGTLFAATTEGAVFVSNDEGLTWTASSADVPDIPQFRSGDIDIDPYDSLRLTLALPRGASFRR